MWANIEWTPATVAVIAVAVAILLAIKYVEYTRDVPLLYLQQQLAVDATRTLGELAIYKSAKLGAGQHLRVGLDIRYDHYKLRQGNLRDIWALRVKQPGSLAVGTDTISYAVINAMAKHIEPQIKGRQQVVFHPNQVLALVALVALMVACFNNQVTVTIDPTTPCDLDEFNVTDCDADDKFDPEYTTESDRGIALRVVTTGNWGRTVVEFTQLNLVSAVASTLKHLPESQQIHPKDKFLVVYNPNLPLDHLLNVLTKWLTSSVAGCSKVWVGSTHPPHETTILSLPEERVEEYAKSVPSTGLGFSIRYLGYSLGKQLFASGPLKLVYVDKSLTAKPHITDYNRIRAQLGARVVSESGVYNIVGPVLATDIFDYRKVMVPNLLSYGAISQSLEIKLTNYHNNEGTLMVRGYTIGKTEVKEQKTTTLKQADGFMPIPAVGSWGSDGCLYVVG